MFSPCKAAQTSHRMHSAAADAPTIRAASMANAVVKSSQEMGSLELRPVNSKTSIRKVVQKQRHHVNMHQVQKGSVLRPTFATRLKLMQLKITSSTRVTPTGDTTAATFSVSMTTSGCSWGTGDCSQISVGWSRSVVLQPQVDKESGGSGPLLHYHPITISSYNGL